ncbi:hypothetical protein PVAP13_8NG234101 [Panicum virgatum]|uniref:Uncharacterized protein n=1 Tax=Panicum virgatum TaxID=38727 RepID=A0A8T0P9E6_PANVG|nr:hypothetical protein PVAP13_8NG234101 [Panicum virgatum]
MPRSFQKLTHLSQGRCIKQQHNTSPHITNRPLEKSRITSKSLRLLCFFPHSRFLFVSSTTSLIHHLPSRQGTPSIGRAAKRNAQSPTKRINTIERPCLISYLLCSSNSFCT